MKKRSFFGTCGMILPGALCLLLISCSSIEIKSSYDDAGYFQKTKVEQAKEDQKITTSTLIEKPMRGIGEKGPLLINPAEAILIALENNKAFTIERMKPSLQKTSEEDQKSVFDPVFTAGISRSWAKTRKEATGGGYTRSVVEQNSGQAGLSEYLPTGTDIGIDFSTDRTKSDLSGDQNVTGAGLSVNQALLNGFGLNVNLASLRQAKIDTASSEYELRGYAETLVSQVESTYWDYILAQKRIDIFTRSLDLANKQLQETEERVRLGALSESEIYAARAEVALRREALINARSILAQTHLRLLRLLNPPGVDLWKREIIPSEKPQIPNITLGDVEEHVKVAMRWRTDLNQARLQLRSGALDLIKTKNGLLPVLDMFINLGKTGYADSFRDSADDTIEGESHDWQAGLNFSYPIGNRAARARYTRAQITQRQSEEALGNMEQLVQVDVRSAYIEINRAKEQVEATAATRRFQEETLRVETEKFRVGKSTSILVASAQRDLVQSQISEIEAIINHIKALIEIYRLEGSLLEHRGINAPGREPVEAPPAETF